MNLGHLGPSSKNVRKYSNRKKKKSNQTNESSEEDISKDMGPNERAPNDQSRNKINKVVLHYNLKCDINIHELN